MGNQADTTAALGQFLSALQGEWASNKTALRLKEVLAAFERPKPDNGAVSDELVGLSQQLLLSGQRDPGGRAAELALVFSPRSIAARQNVAEAAKHYGYEPSELIALESLSFSDATPLPGDVSRLRHLFEGIEYSFREDIESVAFGRFRIWPLIRHVLRSQPRDRIMPTGSVVPLAAPGAWDQVTFFGTEQDAIADTTILSFLDDIEHDWLGPRTMAGLSSPEFHLLDISGFDLVRLAEFEARPTVLGAESRSLRFYRTPWLGDTAIASRNYKSAFETACEWDQSRPLLETLFDHPEARATCGSSDGLARRLALTWAYATYFDELLQRATPRAIVLLNTPSPKMHGLMLAARNRDVTSIALDTQPAVPDSIKAAWPEETLLEPDHVLRADFQAGIGSILARTPRVTGPEDTRSSDETAQDRLRSFYTNRLDLGIRSTASTNENDTLSAEAKAPEAPVKAPVKPQKAKTIVLELDLRDELSFFELYRYVLKIEVVRKALGYNQIYLNVLTDARTSYESWHFHNNMTMALLRLNNHVKGLNMVFTKAELKQYRRWWKRYRSVPYWIMASLPVAELGHRKKPKNLHIGVKPAGETQSLVRDWVKHRAAGRPFVTWSGVGHANGQAKAIFERLDQELAGNYAVLYLPPAIGQIDRSILQDPRNLFAEEALYNLDLRAAFHYAAFANLSECSEAALTPIILLDTLSVFLDRDMARVQRRGTRTKYVNVPASDSERICSLILENYFDRA